MQRRITIESRWSRAVAAIAVTLGAWGLVAPAAVAGLVTAHVNLEVDGDAFDFPAVMDGRVEAAVEDTVCDVIQDYWRLVDWQRAPSGLTSAQSPDLRWIVTIEVVPHEVEDQTGVAHRGIDVFVSHRVEIGSSVVPLELSPELEELYDYRQTPPGPAEIDELVEEVEALLETQLRNLRDSRAFHRQMNTVPLAHSVISDDQGRRIVIPVRFADLAADPDSKLRVTMEGDQLPHLTGRLDLKITGPVLDVSTWEGFVVGPVVDVVPLEPLDPNGQPIVLPQDWDEHFAALIDKADSKSVFLLEYLPAPATSQGDGGIEPVPEP